MPKEGRVPGRHRKGREVKKSSLSLGEIQNGENKIFVALESQTGEHMRKLEWEGSEC